MDKYLPPVKRRIDIIETQIAECQTLIYRNNVENLSFVANGEKAKQKEVEYNNETLKEKVDILREELGRLLDEDSSNPA